MVGAAVFDDVAPGEAGEADGVGDAVEFDACFFADEFGVGGEGSAECSADVVGDCAADGLGAEDDVDAVFLFVDVGDEGEAVTCGLELVFDLVGDFCGAPEFELGGFSAACTDLNDAFVVAAGDAAAAVALFAGPDDFDFLGGFNGDAVEGAGDEDGCN